MRKVIFIFILFLSLLNARVYELTLDSAIDMALKNNSLNKISKLNLELARAQYNQALSANYPTLDAVLFAKRDDRDLIYQQRGNFSLSSEFITLMNTLLTINGIPSSFPNELNADIDTVAYGRDTAVARLEMNYPIYTGGKISALIEQARLNKSLKREAIVRTQSDVVFDTKRYFYGYMLSDSLYKLINDIYKTMEFSRDLTKDFLENGSTLNIKKTDYLNIKLLTSLLKTTLYKIDMSKEMLKGALVNAVGLKYNESVNIVYDEQKIVKLNKRLEDLIKKAVEFNSDMKSLALVLKIKDEQIKEANSDYMPMVNLFGDIEKIYNSYEYGYLHEDNQNRWSIGVAVKMSIFNGFKTENSVLEKRLDKKIVKEQRLLFEDALALQIKNEFIKSSLGYEQLKTLENAVDTAIQNSDINFKGYKYEMVKAQDLVQSQMMEVYVKADYLKSLHDYLISLATIDKLIGTRIEKSH